MNGSYELAVGIAVSLLAITVNAAPSYSQSLQSFRPADISAEVCKRVNEFGHGPGTNQWLWDCGGDPYFTVSAGGGEIELVSRMDNLLIVGVSANRGNCQLVAAITADGRQNRFPFTLMFGNALQLYTGCIDPIIEVAVSGEFPNHMTFIPKS